MSAITYQDISKISKRLTANYLECQDVENVTRCRIFADDDFSKCKATPAAMQELVDDLRQQTENVLKAQTNFEYFLDASVLAAARAVLGPLASAATVKKRATIIAGAQWSKDMDNWLTRLDIYQGHLDDVARDNPDAWDKPEGCKLITKEVIDPLLFGWFWEPMPGIMQTSSGMYDVQTRADWASPFMLGNQLKVYRDSMKEAAEQLLQDLTDPRAGGCTNAWDVRCWPWETIGFWGLIIGGGALTVWGLTRALDIATKIQDLRGDRSARRSQEVRVRVEADEPRAISTRSGGRSR